MKVSRIEVKFSNDYYRIKNMLDNAGWNFCGNCIFLGNPTERYTKGENEFYLIRAFDWNYFTK